ncbi:MAG TPA: anaerobic carbon-monoxide dehydrogenase catalytic subunit [Firmicutes bacterium]|nr:anaerobic carbon-monoxide dehydrogenase catalytic subunit [Bacillota bacterium]
MVDPISEHESVRRMHDEMEGAGMESVVERFEAQGLRCTFCDQGITCQLCSMGPCRITKRAERGACGIDANGMVMRNMVHRANMGVAAYSFHAREVAKTLKATAQGKTPFEIRDRAKLDLLAHALVVEPGSEGYEAATADAMLAALYQDSAEESVAVAAFAPETRKKVWRELGIFPGGPISELVDSTARAMTNIDGDYVSLAKTALRLGVASCYGALVPLEIAQDALFGTPTPHEAYVDLGILDPDYVNILPNGHEPFVGMALVEAARSEQVQRRAREAGAKGLRIVGSIETGQEMMQRIPCDDVFVGLTGNWLNQEFVLATGAVDVFAMDMNCSLPSLAPIAEKYGATLVAVSRLIGVPGVEKRVVYVPENVSDQVQEIISIAIENFKRRKASSRATRDLKRTKILTGFSTEAVVGALGGTLEPLLEVLKKGDVKGVVALVSCTTLKGGGQDTMTVAVAKELIRRNILVLSAGCGNAACQVAGLNSLEAQELAGDGLRAVCKALGVPPVLSFGTCTDTGRLALLVGAVAGALGVDTAALPVAVTAPEYMEQKAVIDAFSAVALGLYTHVAPVPPVTGAADVVNLLTRDVEGLTGGRLAVETDPVAAVDGIERHIVAKRRALGI